MGNIVSQNWEDYNVNNASNSDSMLNNNIKISDFIKEWAINDYDDGLLYSYNILNKKPIGENYSKLLKKRACCVQQINVPVALPLLYNNNVYDNFNHGVISIPVFQNEGELEVKCTRNQIEHTMDLLDNTTYYRKYTKGVKTTAPQACINLYGTYNDVNDKTFCNHIKLDRQSMALSYTTNKEDQKYYISYGKYHNDIFERRNPYIDCNCKNSTLWDDSRENGSSDSGILGKLSNNSTYNKISGEDMSQLIDIKCANAGDRAYKENIANTIGCLQIQNIINNKYTNTTQNNIMNCNLSQSDEKTIRSNLPVSTPDPQLTKSSVPIIYLNNNEDPNNNTYIIITIIIILIAGGFLFIFRDIIF